MNKSIDTVLVINDNEHIGSDQHYQHVREQHYERFIYSNSFNIR